MAQMCMCWVYMLPTNGHWNTQMLAQTLTALLIFSKGEIVIFHVYSYVFIIISNLIKIFTTVTGNHAAMT